MTDMLIDGTISKEVYDDKMIEFNRKLHTLAGKKQLLNESINKDGSPDPYKLTFVLKGNQSGVVPNAKEKFKAKNSEERTNGVIRWRKSWQ